MIGSGDTTPSQPSTPSNPSSLDLGHICLYDLGRGKLVFIDYEDLNIEDYPPARYYPLGAIIIPQSLNFYKTTQSLVRSFTQVDLNNIQYGSGDLSSKTDLCWGGYNQGRIVTNQTTSDGKVSSDTILAKRGSKNYQIWRPSTDPTSTDYPLASLCDMFYPMGTRQGDWYLPSVPELLTTGSSFLSLLQEMATYLMPVLQQYNPSVFNFGNDKDCFIGGLATSWDTSTTMCFYANNFRTQGSANKNQTAPMQARVANPVMKVDNV